MCLLDVLILRDVDAIQHQHLQVEQHLEVLVPFLDLQHGCSISIVLLVRQQVQSRSHTSMSIDASSNHDASQSGCERMKAPQQIA